MEAKKSFAQASTLGSKDKPELEMDPSVLTTFLETYMKLLCNSKAMKGLQKLINRCVGTALGEPHVVCKIKKNNTRTGCEIRLTMQIREYEMDQVIRYLGSDANVLPKQIWERIGRPALQWSLI